MRRSIFQCIKIRRRFHLRRKINDLALLVQSVTELAGRIDTVPHQRFTAVPVLMYAVSLPPVGLVPAITRRT